jgi:hypothetical protein
MTTTIQILPFEIVTYDGVPPDRFLREVEAFSGKRHSRGSQADAPETEESARYLYCGHLPDGYFGGLVRSTHGSTALASDADDSDKVGISTFSLDPQNKTFTTANYMLLNPQTLKGMYVAYRHSASLGDLKWMLRRMHRNAVKKLRDELVEQLVASEGIERTEARARANEQISGEFAIRQLVDSATFDELLDEARRVSYFELDVATPVYDEGLDGLAAHADMNVMGFYMSKAGAVTEVVAAIREAITKRKPKSAMVRGSFEDGKQRILRLTTERRYPVEEFDLGPNLKELVVEDVQEWAKAGAMKWLYEAIRDNEGLAGPPPPGDGLPG